MDNYGDFQVTRKQIVLGCLAVVFVFIFVGLVASIKTITPGQAAVATRFGSLNGVRGDGTHLALFEGYTVYDLKTKRIDGEHETGSRDGQYLFIDTAFSYNLKSGRLPELFSKVGSQEDLENKYVVPVIRDVTYQIAASYSTDEILPKQGEFRERVLKTIRERMNQEYFDIIDLQITDIDFTPEYNKVLEEKQIAEQNAVKDRQVAEQNVQKAQFELDKAKIDAEKDRVRSAELSEAILRNKWIDKWDGKLPTTMAGESELILPLK